MGTVGHHPNKLWGIAPNSSRDCGVPDQNIIRYRHEEKLNGNLEDISLSATPDAI